MGEKKAALGVVDPVDKVEEKLAEVELLVEMGREGGEADVADDLEAACAQIDQQVEALDFRVMLGGKNDASNAFVQITAGAGGVDACDWAAILLRMYTRWAEAHGFSVEEVELASESEGGIRTATIHVVGPYAFGYLKAEIGVHRLVRISPFDSQARRHTAFASVSVTPELEDDLDVEVREEDLQIDTMRAGGAGGQHVNKTESAVRMTHVPTGIVVRCQSQRSQHKNRAMALQLLKAKLVAMKTAARDKELAALYDAKGEIKFGSQIRSYVMHPYQMVKDHRTDFEKGNINGVLDGDLDGFIEEYLRQRGKKAS
jgi:peptide chain release factor 2